MHVHDLVDYVTLEGEKAGLSATKYLKGELTKGESINIICGEGIGYVLPQQINISNIDKIKISFRVTVPHKASYINVYQNNKLIKQIKKQYLIPAEMENLLLDKSIVLGKEDLKIEVADA